MSESFIRSPFPFSVVSNHESRDRPVNLIHVIAPEIFRLGPLVGNPQGFPGSTPSPPAP
jgi:hypothetical protein